MEKHLTVDFEEQVQSLEQELSSKSECAIRIYRDAKQNMSKLSVIFPVDSKSSEASSRGRPSHEFATSSERSRRRKTEELRQSFSSEELCFAGKMSLRSSGDLDSSRMIKDTILPAQASTEASTYKSASPAAKLTTLSANEALSIMVEAKLTRNQYNTIRTSLKENNCQLYPNYETVREAKVSCYPPRSSISITENCAKVKLQDLLDHTCKRILLSQREVMKSVHMNNLVNGNLICKWGCDGSSGQSVYKQKFHDDSDLDANIFLTFLVPLQLTFFDNGSIDSDSKVLWKNPRPSSPRFCRPISMEFLHENTDATKDDVDYIERQISSLEPLKIVIDGREVTVNYKMLFTMIDGKVCNAVTSTSSSQRCYLCGATSKDFNNIDNILEKEVNEENLKFGMSTLHAWIRLFECLLHLSYKLNLKEWQARTLDDKKLVSDRKAQIQKSLKSELGLIVDRPKPGYGSTNDGNTARRFFENHEIVSMITGLNEELIKRFYVILQVITSGYDIHVNNFKEYALTTARLFVSKYPWYYMPSTVHKLLMHGSLIIASAILPIGQLSEEAQEARNKDVKKFREGFSRKSSRENTMQDIFNWLLVSSDPYITSLRKLRPKKLKQLSSKAILLLASPNIRSGNVDPASD